MKLLLLLFISTHIFSNTPEEKILSLTKLLNIKSQKNGECLYTRKELLHTQLQGAFKLEMKNKVPELINKDLSPYWNCIFLTKNFKRDNHKEFIPFEQLKENSSLEKEVVGKIRYLGLINKKYKYTIIQKEHSFIVRVRVHFRLSKKFQKPELTLQTLDEKISGAQDLWNRQMPGNIRFEFSRVENKKDSHFSVRLLQKKTRGPYDTKWSILWDQDVIAHEFGHMLGLDDEYNNASHTLSKNLVKKNISKEKKMTLRKYAKEQVERAYEVELNYLSTTCRDLKQNIEFNIRKEESIKERRICLGKLGYHKTNKTQIIQKTLSEAQENLVALYAHLYTSKCDPLSFMCDEKGQIRAWHIYVILKRLYQE